MASGKIPAPIRLHRRPVKVYNLWFRRLSIAARFVFSLRRFPMSHPSGVSSVATSRRSLVKAGAALFGVSVLGLASRSGYGQAPRTRMDIVTFAQDSTRLANFEGAVKEMQDRSA